MMNERALEVFLSSSLKIPDRIFSRQKDKMSVSYDQEQKKRT